MENKTAFPLCWPAGWPRQAHRETSNFKTDTRAALSFLEMEIRLMRGKNLILSSNATLGNDKPADPGVVAYFDLRTASGKDLKMAIPCDRWNKIGDNVHAIAKTINAMRGMDRWGAKHMIEAMFTGFKQIPEKTGGRSWWEVFGVSQGAPASVLNERYKELAKERHPDRGGTNEAMAELNAAYRLALAQLNPEQR